jgi:hypothetical protein
LPYIRALTAFEADSSTDLRADHEGNTIFASDSVSDEVSRHLDTEQIQNWFGINATLDMEHIIPIYMTLNVEDDSTNLVDTLYFTDTFHIQAIGEEGEILGLATLNQLNNVWVIGKFVDGFDMMDKISRLNIPSSTMCYYVEIPQSGNDFGILTLAPKTQRVWSQPKIQQLHLHHLF